MKKLIIILLLLVVGAANAQYIRRSQIVVVTTQTDLNVLPGQIGDFGYCTDVGKVFIHNGTAWMPSAAVNVKKSAVVINGKTTGSTLIYTMEQSPLKFYPTQVIVRANNISGVTTPPTVSIGTNASSYNNIATGSLLNTLLNTVGATGGSPQNASYSYPITGGTSIYANVSIGALATNYSFTVEIIGFYDNN